MEKTLNKIQKFAKAGSIISKIILWCTLIGAICSSILLIAQLIYGNTRVIADSKIILDVLKEEKDLNIGTIYTACTVAIILCVSEIIVAKKAVNYFAEELKLNTPFDLGLADKLKKLGICTIVVPLVGIVLSNVTYKIFAHYYTITNELNLGNYTSFGLGLSFIFISLICRYVAEKDIANK